MLGGTGCDGVKVVEDGIPGGIVLDDEVWEE